MTERDLVCVTDLEKCFEERRILSIAGLSFTEGLLHALIGPNGSGKTTLLRIIAGLDTPTRGAVAVNLDKRKIGFCFQEPYMFRGTVLSNIAWGCRCPFGFDLAGLAQRLGLSHLLGGQARTLSAGEMRKTALARALACRPSLLLIDEPLSSLDEQGSRAVAEEILGFVENGGTCIVAVHIDDEARRLSARMLRLQDGSIAADETYRP